MASALKDIVGLLDEMAPFSLAEEWDNAGLQIGSPDGKVTKILMALDPTLKAVGQASLLGAQLLLTHHPLIFTPLSRIDLDGYPGDVIREALIKDISIMAIHSNLDAAKGGINDILADLIGLKGIEVLQDGAGGTDSGTGLGRIGNLPESKSLSEMTDIIKDALGTRGLMVMGPGDTMVGRMAIVGGSGGSMASVALRKGADLLLTGDVRHHEALMAETLGLAVIDGGHFRTEKVAFDIFADHFQDRLNREGHEIFIEKFTDEREPMAYG